MYAEVETTNGLEMLLKGPYFNRRILDLMLKFRAQGVDPFDVFLFYCGCCLRMVGSSQTASSFLVFADAVTNA
jgi:hypothetical protein